MYKIVGAVVLAVALLIIAPGIQSGAVGLAMVSPVLLIQFAGWRRERYGGGA